MDSGGAADDEETDFGVIVVGAGFGGLRMLYELRQRGITARVLEEASDVGGTWYWNRYPGARTDSEAWAYCFSFSEDLQNDWDWSERYSAQPEVLQYLQHVADRFDLREDIQFETRVESASFDEASNKWVVVTDRGQSLTGAFFIPATGPLSRPLSPAFEGFDSFEGEWHLTARWPDRHVDFRGKRVGVIGTGATGIQVVPVVAEDAAHVTVFQRTPNYVIPGRNRRLTDAERRDIKDRYDEIWALTQRQTGGFPIAEAELCFHEMSPEEQQQVLERAWQVGGFQFLFDTYRDLMVDEQANDAAGDFIRRQIRATVDDPTTAEMLCPKGYPFGAKRPPLGHGYYETFNRPNVTLVDLGSDPIERVTPRGVQTASSEHECDILIFATGFDGSTGALMAMEIRGRDDRSLNEKWAAGPRTYLGIAVDEFPNMFMVSGPQTPFGNIPVIIDNEVRCIGRAIEHTLSNGLDRLEPTPEVVEEWVKETARSLEATVMRLGDRANSWFLGANVEGKARAPLFYFGRANVYFELLADVADRGFEELIPGHHAMAW